MTEERKISKATHMQALGLFTMAASRFKDGEAFLAELCNLLGVDKDSHFADELYSAHGNFEVAMEKSRIVVEES